MSCDGCEASAAFPVKVLPDHLPPEGAEAPGPRLFFGEAEYPDGWKVEVVKEGGTPVTKWWCPECASSRPAPPVIELTVHVDSISR